MDTNASISIHIFDYTLNDMLEIITHSEIPQHIFDHTLDDVLEIITC